MYMGMYVPTYLNQLISLTDTQQARSAVVEEVFAHNKEQHIFSGLGKHSLQQVTVRHKEILILHISKTTPHTPIHQRDHIHSSTTWNMHGLQTHFPSMVYM